MKIRYTEQEYKQAKCHDLLKLECYECNKGFVKEKCYITRVISDLKCEKYCKYCSKKCQYDAKCKYGKTRFESVRCLQCGLIFEKQNHQVVKSPNHFCSKSCSCTYRNTHKTTGFRRSKLETWLEEQLTNDYPNLTIKYNDKTQINSELDIYIEDYKLAFELNGIFHYEPIYGENKLNQTQNNDQRKFAACLEKGIELCIIDSSKLSYFKPTNAQKYYDIIKNILQLKI